MDRHVVPEPELRAAVPRRVRWRGARWRLWVRIVLAGPLSLALPVLYAPDVGLLALALIGSRGEARIVDRRGALQGFTITVEYPWRSWGGGEQTVREVRALDQLTWGALARRSSLPFLRLGRGGLQVVHLETGTRPVDAVAIALELLLWALPLTVAVAWLAWGRVLRDLWLVRWGHAVPGRVRDGTSRPFWHVFRLLYEYRERPDLPTALLRGRALVSQAEYEAFARGHAVSVLHGTWNPRWSVPYPFARFAAVADDEAAPPRPR